MKQKVLWLSGGLLFYFLIWLWLATPYPFVPCDDFTAWRMLCGEIPIRLHYVWSDVWLKGVYNLVQTPSALAISSLVCNTVCLALITLWMYRITRSVWASLLVFGLYVTSAWPSHYVLA